MGRDRAIRKVFVIGLDGFEPRVAEPLLDAGELPNLARLRDAGCYSRLGTTTPALTPAAWSTFATGTNPGGHGIFDFVHRDPKSYYPTLALNRYEQKNAFVPPNAVNLRRGVPLWDLLGAAGVPSTVLRCPCTYPPDPIAGRLLSGVGVPDLRGGLGTATFYSTDATVRAGESEQVVHLPAPADSMVRTHLIGPRNPKGKGDFQAEISLHIDPGGHRLTVQSDGAPRSLEVREGGWSDWLKVKFKTGLLQSVSGMVRFFLTRLEPQLELYASPINFDPEAPLFPISTPPQYAADLARRLGTYYTTGMVEDHGGLNNGHISEEAYLDQCEGVMRERTAMMEHELDRHQDGLFFCLFDTPDRLAHMFWRTREPDHPANRDGFDPTFAHVIGDNYRACDRVVGQALERADDDTLVMVLSDHGMTSFQRGFHVNGWLYRQGFLALKEGVDPGDGAGDFLRGVDWTRTRAYGLGLGSIYLNLEGREGQGIVRAEDAEALQGDIVAGLGGLADPERGRVAIRSVATRAQLYRGAYAHESPDLVIHFAEGYRVSWETPLGGVPDGLFSDNTKKWGGDHTVDPSLVPGVLFMNRSARDTGRGPDLLDLAPTILDALGVPPGKAMEGVSLLA